MRIIPSCEKCLYDRQVERVSDILGDEKLKYLLEIKDTIINRREEDTAPYMIYLFNRIYEKYFGRNDSYKEIKNKYNSLVMAMENSIEKIINESKDPLETALVFARIGNYIDFGALNDVDENTFISLLSEKSKDEIDNEIYLSFIEKCSKAKKFLLICDNCGEIVLDKLFIKQLKRKFPNLCIYVMVRGEETLNDATMDDAIFCGMDKEANVISNGNGVAGTVFEMLSEEAKDIFSGADVILAKGQGNYESMTDCGKKVFYSFLCKCDLFVNRFDVPRFTGMFVYN